MNRGNRPLYRRVNTRARGVHHDFGGDYRHRRHREQVDDRPRGPMHGKQHRGRDYTPLFRFLLARIGEDWDAVYSQAVARLDRPDPIFWIVALRKSDGEDYVRIGESSYYSGLYVDEANRLRKVNPGLRVEHLRPSCACCTHTFNGVRFTRGFGDRK